jgi:hypothetical protein
MKSLGSYGFTLMKAIFTFLSACFIIAQLSAQQSIHLKINHKFDGAPLILNQQAQNNLGHTFTIGRVDYYISSISIQHDGGTMTAFPEVYIISKGTNEVDVNLGTADVNAIESITFSIGVDASVNNDDPALWPSGHPLSYQSPSMHWGWSSGYRFVAMEGQSGQSLNQDYQLHGLWNDNYFSQTIPITGTQNGNELYINLDADYLEALRDINLSAGPINHGTNSNDLTMLQNFRDYVFSPASNVVGVSETSNLSAAVYPNPANSTFRILGLREQAHVAILDMTGRIIYNAIVGAQDEIKAPVAGTYLVTIITETGNYSQKLIVEP